MLKNDLFIEEFKKSLIATVKSIGKNSDLEINFVKENPSIDGNQINLTRRGYLLATRARDFSNVHTDLSMCYGGDAINLIRLHEAGCGARYVPSAFGHWKEAPNGVDIIADRAIIDLHYSYFDPAVRTLVHIRRGGTVDSQQMGQFMLQRYGELGGPRDGEHGADRRTRLLREAQVLRFF